MTEYIKQLESANQNLTDRLTEALKSLNKRKFVVYAYCVPTKEIPFILKEAIGLFTDLAKAKEFVTSVVSKKVITPFTGLSLLIIEGFYIDDPKDMSDCKMYDKDGKPVAQLNYNSNSISIIYEEGSNEVILYDAAELKADK